MNRMRLFIITLFILTIGGCSVSELFMMPGQPGQSINPAPSPTAETIPAQSADPNYSMVIAESLNLRTCPSTGCETLEPTLLYGDMVEIIGNPIETDNPECTVWLQVRTTDKREGWVCDDWISK